MIAASLARLARDRRGVSAVEFAVATPMLIILFFGGYTAAKLTAVSRKVTITTRALADLTSQYSQMSSSDMSTVMNASAQIIAPFDSTALGMRISEVTTNALGTGATVTWSSSSSSANPAYKPSMNFTLPATMLGMSSTSFVYAETFYVYTPPVVTALGSSFNLGDRIFMLPRVSSSITYSGS